MVLREFRVGAVPRVDVRDACPDGAADLRLRHRDHERFVCGYYRGADLLREKLDCRRGDVGPLVDGKICREREASPAVGPFGGDALANDGRSTVWRDVAFGRDHPLQPEDRLRDEHEFAEGVVGVEADDIPDDLADGGDLSGLDFAAGAVGKVAEQREERGVVEARGLIARPPREDGAGGVDRDGATEEHRRAAGRDIVPCGAELRHEGGHIWRERM